MIGDRERKLIAGRIRLYNRILKETLSRRFGKSGDPFKRELMNLWSVSTRIEFGYGGFHK